MTSETPVPPAPRSAPEAGGVTVLVAGGSAQDRRGVRSILAADERFTVVGEARGRTDLVAMAGELRPSAVVLDPELPKGVLPALADLMATHPVPVVIYGDERLAGAATQAELRAAGAIDVVIRSSDDEATGDELRSCVLLAARIRVIRHPRGRLNPTPAVAGPRPPLIVIGASTGGPSALGALLAGLPADLTAGVVVVQHMPAGFVPGLAGWLDTCCALPVSLGADGRLVRPGEVVICPGDLDSRIEYAALPALGKLRCTPPHPAAHHIPSVDEAFRSVAATVGPRAIGVLLTGMGSDGAAGMAALRAAGAATIAQDESTSAIYGMPRAAAAAGVVDRILPLPDIAATVTTLVTSATAERDPERVTR